jgi:basic amino acid/polyamine antiporter, APA family
MTRNTVLHLFRRCTVPSQLFQFKSIDKLTVFAFVLVSIGVIVLRRRQPDRPRGFRVPLVPWFPLASVVRCGRLMTGITMITWIRFVVWLGLGLLVYIFYSRRHSEFAQISGGDKR